MRSINLILILPLLLGACAGQQTRTGEGSETQNATAQKPLEPAVVEAFALALRDMRDGHRERARTEFEQLTRSHPRLTGPHVNLGILLLESDPQQAEQALRAALRIDPGHAAANNQMGLLLRRQGRFTEAEAAYQAALAEHPDYLPAQRNIGILYDLYLGQPAKALHHYRQCQTLVSEPDQQIAGWILDLERRTQGQQP